nr:vacuolar protein-sorting-associated protein 25 isoform X2 [Delphinus delphis]
MAMSFEWPWQYRFPPFFTLQPNVDTRQKQLAAWCSLVLSFCRLHKQSSMTVMEAQESPLFNNVKLQRILPQALPHPPHMHFPTCPDLTLLFTHRRPLTVVASPAADSPGSGRAGSAAMAHQPSRSAARGIFPDWGTNPRPLHQQVDSQPLRHQGSP